MLAGIGGAAYGRRVIGWIGDFFRFWWGLLYWNTRKGVFRLRRGRGRCPCQDPSDSGRALETGCEAIRNWNRPARFRRVCPLLVTTPAGLRCAANTPDVRPFWGRAFAWFGGGAAGLYLLGTLAVFILLRSVGYPVPYTDVALLRRAHFRAVRSDYFFAKAQSAYGRNELNEAVMSYALAYQLNPKNYPAGILLAGLWQVGQPALADQLYAQLLRTHPEHAEETAQLWYRTLLAHGNFPEIQALAGQRLRARSAQAPAWVHALLFATRMTGDNAPLRDLLAPPRQLAPGLQTVLRTELLVRQRQPDAALKALTTTYPESDSAYLPYYQASRLIALGHPRDALAVLNAYGSRVGAYEQLALKLDAWHALGWEALVQSEIDRLSAAPPSGRTVELLATYVIRHADATALNALFAALRQNPLPATPENYSAYSALFCACGVCRDWPKLAATAALLKKIAGTQFNTLDTVEAFFKGKTAATRLETFLPALQPLPMETIYALFGRYEPPPAAAPPAAP